MVSRSGEGNALAINVQQEPGFVPDTIDAVRAAMTMQTSGEEAVEVTDHYLGIG